jgi:hypothetical protein
MNQTTSNVGILALLTARVGKEKALRDLLFAARGLAVEESFTVTWYAVQAGPQSFAIFDTFADDGDRTKHLEGRIAQALLGRADELLASPPDIREVDVIAVK